MVCRRYLICLSDLMLQGWVLGAGGVLCTCCACVMRSVWSKVLLGVAREVVCR